MRPLCLACCILALLAGCGETTATPTTSAALHADDDWPARDSLLRTLYRRDSQLLLIHPGGPHADAYRAHLRQHVGRRWQRFFTFDMQPADSVRREDLVGRTVVLVGTAATNPWLGTLAEALPVGFGETGFVLGEKTYTDASAVLHLLYPNPATPARALLLVAGNSQEGVFAFLEDRRLFGQWQSDYAIFRDGLRRRWGQFTQEPPRWRYDAAQNHDLDEAHQNAVVTEHFRFIVQQDALRGAALDQLIARRTATAQRVTAFLGMPPVTPIDYVLYPTLEAKALATDDMRLAHARFPQRELHLAYEANLEAEGLGREISLLLRDALGPPTTPILETGLAVHLTDAWHGRGYRHWAGRLAAAETLPPLTELLDPETPLTPLVAEPLAGTLVDVLLETWGRKGFLQRYATWQPTAEDIHNVEYMWKTYVEALAHEANPDPPGGPLPRLLKGFNFAHEGYSIFNGYGAARADTALARIAALGGNAAAVLPYTFMRDPHRPVPLRVPTSVGSENDGSVIHAILGAQAQGLTVVLKPHIWLGRSWPGEIEMQTDADWQAFFQHYERWMRHYALMAAIYEVDLLCLGVELGKFTTQHEDWWRAFAGRMRTLYGGPLTYAANWGEEFEALTFWDAFDYLGLDNYYPLTKADAPTDADLRAGADAVVARIAAVQERFGKPLLFTETGFPSYAMPWKNPHQDQRGAPYDGDAQARSYEALAQALDGQPWLAGVLWWKWPSDLSHGGPTHASFTPNRKPAEAVVARWFARW